MPYLLLDIFLQLLATIPVVNIPSWADLINTIGISTVWNFSPSDIYLGQDVTVSLTLNPDLGNLILKAIAYFLISIQLWLVNSAQFQKFSNKLMLANLENKN